MKELLNEPVKVVYSDSGKDKVVRGVVTDIDRYTITVRAHRTGRIIVIGKKAITTVMLQDRKD